MDNDDDEDEDVPILKYESHFVKRRLVPHEPRLFCLIYNTIVVDYGS